MMMSIMPLVAVAVFIYAVMSLCVVFSSTEERGLTKSLYEPSTMQKFIDSNLKPVN